MLSRADRLKFASQNVAAPPVPLIAPIKGWNTRDALDAMDPADAILSDNLYPDANGVNIRNGFVSYATCSGASGPVKTLAEYNAGGTRKFLAAASGGIYDVSASGASGLPLASGFSNDGWQTVSFLSRLFLFNGSDTAQVYNGSTVANQTFTGVTLSTLAGATIYQNRLFTWQNNSTGFWYAPLNSINGALNFFDLAPFTLLGGNLVAATTYSHDGGNGVLDFICFILSSGVALIYYGNDPADVNNWQLIGIYRISPPVGPRAVCNYGAEAFLTTYDDHVPLQQQLVALKNGALPPRSKVSTAVQAAVQANLSAFGWQALYYPRGRRLIFNIPNTDGSFSQHVQNTGMSYQDNFTGETTSPWCRFQNMNAFCWGLYKDSLYFGAQGGTIWQADTGTLDNTSAISANGQQSWNMFKNPARKRVTAARPVMNVATGGLTYSFGLAYDYGQVQITTDAAIVGGGSPWDVSPWDVSPWSPEDLVSTAWYAVGGSGVSISPTVAISSTNGGTWLRSDFRFEEGTYL